MKQCNLLSEVTYVKIIDKRPLSVHFKFSTYVSPAAVYLKLPLLKAFGQVVETDTKSFGFLECLKWEYVGIWRIK